MLRIGSTDTPHRPSRPAILGGPTQRDSVTAETKISVLCRHIFRLTGSIRRGGGGWWVKPGQGVDAARNTNLLLFGQRQDGVCAQEFDVAVTVHPLSDLWMESSRWFSGSVPHPHGPQAFIQ